MTTICSKIDSIDRLWFEPIPAKAVAVKKIVRVGDRTTVAVGENGKIYTNGVQSRVAYSCHGNDGRIADVLDGCIKLGVLTANAVRQHKSDVQSRLDKREKKWAAEHITSYAEKLGIEFSAEQIKVIEKAQSTS